MTGRSIGHWGNTSASCCTFWGKVITCPLYALCPPLCFVYTCITGEALAINISSNCVKPCNSLQFLRNWWWYHKIFIWKLFQNTFIPWTTWTNIVGIIVRFCFQRPSFLAYIIMINSIFYTIVKFCHILFCKWLRLNWHFIFYFRVATAFICRTEFCLFLGCYIPTYSFAFPIVLGFWNILLLKFVGRKLAFSKVGFWTYYLWDIIIFSNHVIIIVAT